MANAKNEKTTQEIVQSTKSIELEGTETLQIERLFTTYKVVKKLDKAGQEKIISKEMVEEKTEMWSFPLTQVSADQIREYRKEGTPSFVLKAEGKLYHATIPDFINFMAFQLLGPHMCATAGRECHRLSAASDEKGGCEKVRNRANYIERYDWIVDGYETFNTKHDSFVVINCLHYEPCPIKRQRTAAEINNSRVRLAQFVWPEVSSLAEVKEKKRRTKGW